MSFLEQLFTAQLTILGQQILWREVIGNGFGFASAIGGLRRRVWAWPVGISGNLLLFTVFFGVAFANPQHTTLYGQAGRQVFFIITSVYGWWRWSTAKRGKQPDAPAITPRWATARERMVVGGLGLLGVVVMQQVFFAVGAGWPAPRWYYWSDAWIFVGSIVATYAMARGWNEFWLVWLAVDAVGVPLLVESGFYPSAVLYAAYGVLVAYGFVVWWRTTRSAARISHDREDPETAIVV